MPGSQGRCALQFIDPGEEEIKLCFLSFLFLRWTLLCCVAEGVFELLIFLPSPPGGWDYRCAPPHPNHVVLRIEPRA